MMVSRIFSSISGMLSFSPSASTIKEKEDDDTINDNEPESTAQSAESSRYEKVKATLEKKSHPKISDFDVDLQFINAESLDRAIVQRLTSRVSTSVADALEPQVSGSRVKLRCEDMQNGPIHMPNQEGNPTDNEPMVADILSEQEQMHNTTSKNSLQTYPSAQRESGHRSRSASRKNTNYLNQNSQISQNMPSIHSTASNGLQNDLIEDSYQKPTTDYAITDDVVTTVAPDNRRSVMYRNSQFNLENSSREALCSNSSKLFRDGNFNSDTSLHLPMFGIPDPSQNRRPSLTSSTEAIRGSESKSTVTTLTDTKYKKRSRSASPSGVRPLPSVQISTSLIGDNLLESSINDIIERGGDDFKTKYSSWIWDAFRTQLHKLKSLMLVEFNEKIRNALEEREQEVKQLQQRYRQKLAEFDETNDNFQRLMDNMYKENQRLITAKDFIIDKLKKEFLECKRHFEQDLQRQLQSYRKDAEMESMELQKRNDELMTIMLTDASSYGLEEVFKNEIESLHNMIKALTAQNEQLHQQLEQAANSASVYGRNALDNLEAQLDHTTVELMELRKQHEYSEREKQDLTVSYHQEIAKLNRKIQETNTRYEHQLRDSAEQLETLRKKHARETKELKQKLANQDMQYNTMMHQVRQQYGSQVESLSLAVSQLRGELSGNNGR